MPSNNEYDPLAGSREFAADVLPLEKFKRLESPLQELCFQSWNIDASLPFDERYLQLVVKVHRYQQQCNKMGQPCSIMDELCDN